MADSHRHSTSGIYKLRRKWREHRSYRARRESEERAQAARLERERQREVIIRRLGDPLRTPASKPPLGMLREVGIEQLSMQVAGAGILVAQAGGIIAGAGVLAVVDIALEGWLVILLMAVASAGFALRALLGVESSTGPTPFQILEGRNIFDEPGSRYVLADDEVEWLLVGDVEATFHENEARLRTRARWVSRAFWILLVGLVVLAIQQIEHTGDKPSARQTNDTAYYNGFHAQAARSR